MAVEARSFLSGDGQTMVLCPLKCGFSTFNHHLIKPGVARNGDLAGLDPLRTRVIFMTRDPVSRFLAFYKNWVVDKGLGDPRPPVRFMHDWLPPDYLQRLGGLTPAEKARPDEILTFLRNAGPAILNEGHMAPQWAFLYRAGLRENSPVTFVDYRQGLAVIRHVFGVEAAVRNVSGSGTLDITPAIADALDLFYWRDRALTRQAAACFP